MSPTGLGTASTQLTRVSQTPTQLSPSLTSSLGLISMSSVRPTVCLLSFLQVRENLNNDWVRSRPIDDGGEASRLCAAKEYVREAVAGQLVEMHAENLSHE